MAELLTTKAFMCGTDIRFEMQDSSMWGECKITPNLEYAKGRTCYNECGIAEVEVRFIRWVEEPEF